MKTMKLTGLGDQRRALDSDPLEDAFALAVCLMSIGLMSPIAIQVAEEQRRVDMVNKTTKE